MKSLKFIYISWCFRLFYLRLTNVSGSIQKRSKRHSCRLVSMFTSKWNLRENSFAIVKPCLHSFDQNIFWKWLQAALLTIWLFLVWSIGFFNFFLFFSFFFIFIFYFLFFSLSLSLSLSSPLPFRHPIFCISGDRNMKNETCQARINWKPFEMKVRFRTSPFLLAFHNMFTLCLPCYVPPQFPESLNFGDGRGGPCLTFLKYPPLLEIN